MPRCWNADYFLDFLNHVICHENGMPRVRTNDEREQESFAVNTVKKFVFTKDVDVVIVGFCSWEEDESHLSWLQMTLKGTKLKNVCMFATCCGSYTKEFQEAIRQRFPERCWLFPDMCDLGDNFGSDRTCIIAAGCLMKAGIIAPE